MQKIIKNKLFLPIAALAIVGVIGATYTMTHSGPTTANAQSTVVNSNAIGQDKDKETNDDAVSPKPSEAVQEKVDATENDKGDSNNATHEVEDGK